MTESINALASYKNLHTLLEFLKLVLNLEIKKKIVDNFHLDVSREYLVPNKTGKIKTLQVKELIQIKFNKKKEQF